MKKHVFIKCAAACLLLAAAFSALGGCSSENTDTPAVIIFAGDPQSAPETRYDYSAWAGILEQAAETAPDSNYLVIGGDLVNEYSDPEEWSAFFSFGGERLEHFGEKVFPVPGNHTSDEDTTREYFELPKSGCPDGLFYSFDAGDIHFIMLDSIAMGTRDALAVSRITEWIRGDLESSEGKWNIAVMHHPMFPMADSRKDRIRADTMCKNYLPVLTDGGVCALLCGHEHAYARLEAGSTNSLVRAINPRWAFAPTNTYHEIICTLVEGMTIDVAPDKLVFKSHLWNKRPGTNLRDHFELYPDGRIKPLMEVSSFPLPAKQQKK